MICALLLSPGAVHHSPFVSPPGDLNCAALEIRTTWRKEELGFGWWRWLWGTRGTEASINSEKRAGRSRVVQITEGIPKRQKVEQESLLSGPLVPPLLAREGTAAGRDVISLAQTPDWPLCILSVCPQH